METKTCACCLEVKATNMFNKSYNRRDGLDVYCKSCCKLKSEKYNRSIKGFVRKIYNGQLYTSNRRNYAIPSYTFDDLLNYCVDNKIFMSLYYAWTQNGYLLDDRPSINRINDYDGYSFDNIEVVTFKQNREKSYEDKINGINNKQSKAVIQFNKDGSFVKEFYSSRQAERETGISSAVICGVCNGTKHRKTAGGFVWKYKQ